MGTAAGAVGIQGGEASYHHIFAMNHLPQGSDIRFCRTFPELFQGVSSGRLRSGIAAEGNNRKDGIPETHQALRTGDFFIVGEGYERIDHQLMGVRGSKLGGVREVHTQDHAREQCGKFLHSDRLPAGTTQINQDDTALSAQLVAEWADPSKVAIASPAAADLYGLEILAANVQDDADNMTRFLHLEHRNGQQPAETDDKSTILVDLKDRPGALYHALAPIYEEGVNLTGLRTYYKPNTGFDYEFLMEFGAGGLDPRTERIVKALGGMGQVINIGSYKSVPIPELTNGGASS